jgi:hypothetical protein
MYKNINNQKGIVNIALIIILLCVLGIVGFGYMRYSSLTESKSQLQEEIATQITNLENLENHYDDILVFLKNSNSGVDAYEEDSSVRGVTVSSSNNNEVLGLEDSDLMVEAREESELYKEGLTFVENIKDHNEVVSSIASAYFSDVVSPVEDTETFIENSEALLEYLHSYTRLSIEAITVGAEIGDSILFVLDSEASEESIKGLKTTLETLQSLKTRAEDIDTSKIDSELQENHQEFIDAFESETKIFFDILEALENEDFESFIDYILLLSSSSESASDISKSKFITFWEEDEVINSVGDIKALWEDYSSEIKEIDVLKETVMVL